MSVLTLSPSDLGSHLLASRGSGPYEPSIASSASSSQLSVFSGTASEHSSVASSISDDFRSSQDERDCVPPRLGLSALEESQGLHSCKQQLSYADVTSVPSDQRQHPRRSSLAKHQRPPPLVRQAERKLTFVDNLVDSATQMVEVIWPLSMVPCPTESTSGRCVLPLRTYIEETLRRSRTSYSTLQVALYYLVLIKAFVPKHDFTTEQSSDCAASRALMCGRRMFLAALILASKYLQDRNYSAKAWSKMSGLKVAEINSNERTFLSKIDWKLHIAKPLFDRWTEVVLKYQTQMSSTIPGFSVEMEEYCWKKLVPMLTPALDDIPLPESMASTLMQPSLAPCVSSPATPTPSRSAMAFKHMSIVDQDTTPTPSIMCPPSFLEPQPDLLPPTLPRMGPLPTPQMTPQYTAFSTPAASVFKQRRPSICSAMALAQYASINRCTSDSISRRSTSRECGSSRRLSISSMLSMRASPESIISDNTRSSRASSISSVATASSAASSVAPPRPALARLATTRNARQTGNSMDYMVDDTKPEGSACKPIIIAEDEEAHLLPSPPDFSISEKALHAPHRHSKHQHQHTPSAPAATEKSRKRHRVSRGNRRSDFYDEVRFQLEDQDVHMADLVDDDEDMVAPSPAATQASAMLRGQAWAGAYREAQEPATITKRDSLRVPVQRTDSKRSCCTSKMEFQRTPKAVWAGL
nr:hypothetical protein B0A51_14815 [Rachicladosporium sp. CCFEE 5018]